MLSSNSVRVPALFLTASIFGSSCQTGKFSDVIRISASDPGIAVFEDSVKPVLEHRCIQCHNNAIANGGLNFQNRNSMFAANDSGPFIVPGSPENSRVWEAIIRPADHPHTMPRDGWGMDQDDKEAFKQWIEMGAAWPKGEAGDLKVKEYRVTRREYL